MTVSRHSNKLFNYKEQDVNGRVAMDFKLKGPTMHPGATQISLQMPEFKQGLHIFSKWPRKLGGVPVLAEALELENPISSPPFLAAS